MQNSLVRMLSECEHVSYLVVPVGLAALLSGGASKRAPPPPCNRGDKKLKVIFCVASANWRFHNFKSTSQICVCVCIMTDEIGAPDYGNIFRFFCFVRRIVGGCDHCDYHSMSCSSHFHFILFYFR